MANIELDGANKKIKVDSGDLTLDVPGDIILDADGADLVFADGGTNILKVTNSSSDVVFQPQVDAKDIIFKQYDGTTVATVEDNGTFNIPTDKLAINGTAVTSTAAELNILDGVTATASELNLLDGGTSVGSSITLADADGIVVNDGGTMKTIPASDVKTYAGGAITALNNATENELVSVGSTTTELDAEGGLTTDGSTLTIKPGSNVHQLKLEQDNATDYWSLHADSSGGPLSFQRYTGGAETERMRLLSDGKFFVGTSVDGVYNDSSGVGGFNFNPTSTVALAVNGARPLMLNRIGDGGTIAEFYQGGGFVGSISESGGTVSYNAFAGSHWSRLADNSKPTILRGTVMESISTLCNWYQVEFTVTIDEENIIKKESITLPSGKSVGDIIKHTYQGVEYDAKILKEDNERLPMCKISNTEDSKAVYGVFMTWDNEPDDGVNDMLVTALGAFVVRIHKDETVAIGDYLQSKGDGTAKKQADDILRASTIAKVTSTEKTHEYADGSYCVPCTLHCG